MEAAWISAKRGHDITIYEKSGHLGGTFLVAAYPPGKSEITKMLAYYEYQCKKNNVKVVFNVEVDESVIKKEAPAKACCENVYAIGDAKKAGNVYTATHKAMDVAYAALYLATDEAKFVTGVNLPADGGVLAY